MIRSRAAAGLVALSLATSLSLGSGVVHAAPPTGETSEGPALPSVDDEPGVEPLPQLEPESPADPQSAPQAAPQPESAPREGAIEPPPPSMQEPMVLRVAVGLSPELDGRKQDKLLLDRLEAGVAASTNPRADVRRLKVGAAEATAICREGLDDLVIRVGYLPEREDPVLLTRDCRIDEELGVRAAAAADDPALLGVLWSEHNDRVDAGARERRRARVSPRLRNGLIAGAAVAVIGVALGLLIAGAAQRETVVLVISP